MKFDTFTNIDNHVGFLTDLLQLSTFIYKMRNFIYIFHCLYDLLFSSWCTPSFVFIYHFISQHYPP